MNETDIPVNSRMLGLKDVTVHVEDTGGDGRPVILIHGWPLSGASWSKQIDALKNEGFRVITYDRRGFGQSDKPKTGYDYDTLSDDLAGLINELDLHNVSLVGFSMGGGEVARYISRNGEDRLKSIVFAAAVPPMMLKTDDNPDGPLTKDLAAELTAGLTKDENAFYKDFVHKFFTAKWEGPLLVTDAEYEDTVALAHQADKAAALQAMAAFATTDFRDDLPTITVPTLVIHGDQDGTVPFEGSGERTHEAVQHSKLVLIEGAPHGLNVSHSEEFNAAVIDFLKQ